MQRYTVYLHMETALHVSGGTSTYHQERKQLYLQHLVFVTPLLLPAAIAAGSSKIAYIQYIIRYMLAIILTLRLLMSYIYIYI